MALAPAPNSSPTRGSSSPRHHNSRNPRPHPTTNPPIAPPTAVLRTLRRLDALGGARSSLPSLRQPHGDHRDLRAGSSSSPSPLGAGDRHRNEYVMMPDYQATIALSPAGFCRSQQRSAVVPFPHAISYAISRPFAQSTPPTPRRGAVSPNYPHRRLSTGPELHGRCNRNLHSAR